MSPSGTDATYDRADRRPRRGLHLHASALDASDIAVLYGSVSAAPTVMSEMRKSLSRIAALSVRRGTTQDAYHTWDGQRPRA